MSLAVTVNLRLITFAYSMSETETSCDREYTDTQLMFRLCHIRSVFKMSCLFLRPRPWQFEI